MVSKYKTLHMSYLRVGDTLFNTPPPPLCTASFVRVQLHEILRPFLIRRMKKDVLANDGLPPKREVVVYAGMTTMQRGYYDLVEKNALRETLVSPCLVVGRFDR